MTLTANESQIPLDSITHISAVLAQSQGDLVGVVTSGASPLDEALLQSSGGRSWAPATTCHAARTAGP